MKEQNILSVAEAQMLIENSRFGLSKNWHTPALAQALSCSVPFECTPSLGNAIRAFMNARVAPDKIDYFLKLWTALNSLRNHIAARFEATQTTHLHLEPGKLPRRYRIQMMDYLSLSAFSLLIDPVHPLPQFGDLRSPVFRNAERALGNIAESLLRECRQNPKGVLAQLTKEPSTTASQKPHTGTAPRSATEKLFSLTEEIGLSPLVFVMLVAAYELRSGLLHGSIPLPLLPNEQSEELAALDLCSCVLDAFLDQTLPQAVQQLDAGDGHIAPFPEPCRQTIAHYLDHRFDGYGIGGILRKYGLIW